MENKNTQTERRERVETCTNWLQLNQTEEESHSFVFLFLRHEETWVYMMTCFTERVRKQRIENANVSERREKTKEGKGGRVRGVSWRGSGY